MLLEKLKQRSRLSDTPQKSQLTFPDWQNGKHSSHLRMILNYHSFQPKMQKINAINNLIQKLHNLSNKLFWNEKMGGIIDISTLNGYPISKEKKLLQQFFDKNSDLWPAPSPTHMAISECIFVY